MRRAAGLFVLGVALGGSSCGGSADARDQWTVWIATDAPSPALVDRALVEVVDDQGELACNDCRRQLGLPTDPSAWPISFGVVPRDPTKTLHVRVRLYRAQRSGADGFPESFSAIDRVATLPPARGDTNVALTMHAECIGLVSSTTTHETCNGPDRAITAEITLAAGKPDPSFKPGTWSRSQRIPCNGDAPEGMICHPGGFFILGDAKAPSAVATPPRPERFVMVKPFALAAHEVTVGTVRELVKAGKISAPTTRDPDSTVLDGACTYLGMNDPKNDAFPVNCVTHDLALRICEQLGARLPTEAEWEWAAGNLERESFYSWGDRGDPCDFADVGLGRYAYEGALIEASLCRSRPGRETRSAGLPAVASTRDVTELGVFAMGGGVSEFVADRLARYDGPCWSPEEPFLDNPTCGSGPLWVIRGSAWSDTPGFASSHERQGVNSVFHGPNVGVRCAVSME